MFKVGILQGRVIPESMDKLQVFPISHWQKELVAIREMGFEYVELLYDKGLVCKKLFSCQKDFDTLGIVLESRTSLPIPHSICVDHLASVNALNNWKEFYGEIVEIARKVKTSKVNILVIPFFDENSITTMAQLEAFLSLCEEYDLDGLAVSHNVQFALEFSLPAEMILAGLKKYNFGNIKVCYDLGNAKAMGYSPEEEIATLGDHICHVHIKDRCVDGPNVMLGEGEVDFAACFNALKENSYKGVLVLETKYFEFPAIEAAKNLQFINNIITDSRI